MRERYNLENAPPNLSAESLERLRGLDPQHIDIATTSLKERQYLLHCADPSIAGTNAFKAMFRRIGTLDQRFDEGQQRFESTPLIKYHWKLITMSMLVALSNIGSIISIVMDQNAVQDSADNVLMGSSENDSSRLNTMSWLYGGLALIADVTTVFVARRGLPTYLFTRGQMRRAREGRHNERVTDELHNFNRDFPNFMEQSLQSGCRRFQAACTLQRVWRRENLKAEHVLPHNEFEGIIFDIIKDEAKVNLLKKALAAGVEIKTHKGEPKINIEIFLQNLVLMVNPPRGYESQGITTFSGRYLFSKFLRDIEAHKAKDGVVPTLTEEEVRHVRNIVTSVNDYMFNTAREHAFNVEKGGGRKTIFTDCDVEAQKEGSYSEMLRTRSSSESSASLHV